MLQKEMEVIEKFRKRHKNRGIDEDEENKKKILPKVKKRKVSSKYKDIYNLKYSKISTINYDKNKNTSKMQLSIDNEKSNINTVNNAKRKSINFVKLNKLQLQRTNSIRRGSSYIDIYNRKDKDLPFADKRFKICKKTFEERFKELTIPFENLLRNNNINTNILPKIIKFNGLSEK